MTPYSMSDGRSADSEADSGSRQETSAGPQVVLLLFAAARVAAGVSRDRFQARYVHQVLQQARNRYGSDFATVLDGSKVWVNGEPAAPDQILGPGDEVAVLPPVSGGD